MQYAVDRCAQIAADIEAGEIVLPQLEKDARWCLLDSGSTITAANRDKHFPRSKINNVGKSAGE